MKPNRYYKQIKIVFNAQLYDNNDIQVPTDVII